MTAAELAVRIDHAVLAPQAIGADVEIAARSCMAHRVRGLCVAPRRAALAFRALEGEPVKLVVVVGFPSASSSPSVVVEEARRAVQDGADELDLVLSWGAVLEGSFDALRHEVASVVDAAGGRPVKGIVEASELSDADVLRVAREVLAPAGATWLKTGTGVHGGPLAPPRISVLARGLPPPLRLKVSGGIRDRAAAERAIEAGADLLGCSRTFAILAGS